MSEAKETTNNLRSRSPIELDHPDEDIWGDRIGFFLLGFLAASLLWWALGEDVGKLDQPRHPEITIHQWWNEDPYSSAQ